MGQISFMTLICITTSMCILVLRNLRAFFSFAKPICILFLESGFLFTHIIASQIPLYQPQIESDHLARRPSWDSTPHELLVNRKTHSETQDIP